MIKRENTNKYLLLCTLVSIIFSLLFLLSGILTLPNFEKITPVINGKSYLAFVLFSAGITFLLFFSSVFPLWAAGKSGKENQKIYGLLRFFPIIPMIASLVVLKSLQPGEISPDSFLKFAGVSIFISVFPVLVIQRYAALSQKSLFKNGEAIAGITKAITILLMAIATIATLSGFNIWNSGFGTFIFSWGLKSSLIIIFLISLELIIKLLIKSFFTKSPMSHAAPLEESYIALFLFDGVNPFKRINQSFKKFFGIDIAASWTIKFFKMAGVQLLALILLIAWGTTGMTSLEPNQRGVYERLGKVSQVFKPGLHFHLPWPFGNVKRMDYGVERRILLAGKRIAEEAKPEERRKLPVEAKTTKWEDRLWETSHGREVFFLTASNSIITSQGKEEKRGVRPYEITNADIVIHYRTGLEDKDAITACYSVVKPEELVLRQAGRWVQAVFAASTPENLIGSDRKILGKKMQKSLQKEMDLLDTGIEITGIYFEAIHPPIQAATSFYDVQAAVYDVKAQIAFAKANAKRMNSSAQINATSVIDSAKADAHEILSDAVTRSRLFTADSKAFALDPKVFEIETKLSVFNRISDIHKIYIVDDRIPWESGYTVDFRKLANDPVKIMAE